MESAGRGTARTGKLERARERPRRRARGRDAARQENRARAFLRVAGSIPTRVPHAGAVVILA